MNRLAELQTDEKETLDLLLAKGQSVSSARQELYLRFPDAKEYHYHTFLEYTKSNEGKEAKEKALIKLREEVATLPYVHRAERLHSLVEILQSAIQKVSKKDLSTTEFVSLSGEVRQLCKEIREEAIPYDSQASVSSPLEEFVTSIQAMDGPTRLAIFGELPGKSKS